MRSSTPARFRPRGAINCKAPGSGYGWVLPIRTADSYVRFYLPHTTGFIDASL